MTGLLLSSTANWPIVGQIAWLMGKLMNFIYTTLDQMLTTDVGLVGLSMVIYTVIVYMVMLPMTINQQKSSKMQAAMTPEINKIRDKYKNKKDQTSMMKQQEEMQQVYDKYGTSMLSSCLPLLIQMPFLFALYPVILDIKKYVPAIKNAPAAVNRFLTIPDITVSPADMMKNSGSFGVASWIIIATAIALPLISAVTQFVSNKLLQSANQTSVDSDNPMAGSMKTMTYIMPLMSVFIVFSSPCAIGIYWIVSAFVRLVQQLLVNKHLKKMSIDEIIEKNREKAKKKQEKRGEKAEKINTMANVNTRNIKENVERGNSGISESEREKILKEAKEKTKDAKPGSLADKANLVRKYNENK
ncbi:YidC/Oxa1 family membrane protein insertase [Aequitasia blattaphilus]|uniref:YidC/Oxa1 family membrane protein insertase n=1 Tax=Aequitasia blattaphilus TaxID=2949332 RepID=A0ABT1EB99_9FIRM|nr:YidC/Oxa1 family membrane protein insertase [Aequitasia blattaphilus]MCP1103109.1 YidC/Oxa1 family membrane protein insertase [Aequitasia blattaphilus]MCR8615749.1 YidC/Oxa1 family membrane protein insertase [Aequitasia blattaphilus]